MPSCTRLLASGSFGVVVLLGSASAKLFLPPSTVSTLSGSLSAVAIADLDGDGDLDIAAADRSNDQVHILLNQGDGFFVVAAPVAVGDWPVDVALGDLDSDGDIDLVTANLSGDTISIAYNNGDATFGHSAELPMLDGTFRVILADINMDGLLDIVVANVLANNVHVLRNFGEGDFFARGSYTIDSPQTLAIGNLDGDDRPDLVVGGGSYVWVLRDNGVGFFGAATGAATGAPVNDVAIADLDGDGDADFAAVSDNQLSSRRLYTFLNDGNGTFTSAEYSGFLGSALQCIAMGRIDAGTSVDAVVFSNQVAILTNDGTSDFTLLETHGWSTTDGTLADIDGDTDLDIVFVTQSGLVRSLVNQRLRPRILCPADVDGSATVDAADFVVLASNYGSVVPAGADGDLNGDGVVDAADFVVLASSFGTACP